MGIVTEAWRRFAGGRLVREAGLVLAGNMASVVFRFAVVVILLGNTLTTREMGILSGFLATMDLVSIFADLGVGTTLVRYLAARRDARPWAIVLRCLSIKAAVTAVTIVAALAAHGPCVRAGVLKDGDARLFAAAVAGGLLLSWTGFALSILQAYRWYWLYAIFTAASNGVRLLVLGGMMAWGFTSLDGLAPGFFLAPALVLVLAAIWALLPLRAARGPGEDTPPWSELARYTAPIALLQGVAILIMRAANFILNAQAPEEAVARYEIAYQVAFVFPVLTRALFTVLLPEVSAMTTHAEMNRYRNRVFSLSPFVLVLTGVVGLAVPPVAGLLLGGSYRDAAPIMQVLLLSLGLGLIYNPLSVLFYALGKPGYNTLIHVVQLVVLIPLDMVLIARYEGMGAAWGWVIITVLALVAAWAWTGSLLDRLHEHERGNRVV